MQVNPIGVFDKPFVCAYIGIMQVSVFGSGAVGRTMAGLLASRGCQVMMGSRFPNEPGLIDWAKKNACVYRLL